MFYFGYFGMLRNYKGKYIILLFRAFEINGLECVTYDVLN